MVDADKLNLRLDKLQRKWDIYEITYHPLEVSRRNPNNFKYIFEEKKE